MGIDFFGSDIGAQKYNLKNFYYCTLSAHFGWCSKIKPQLNSVVSHIT